MQVLVVNTGSTSVKLAAFGFENAEPCSRTQGQWPARDRAPRSVIEAFLSSVDRPDVVVHRVVHGGPDLVDSVFVDDPVEREIERLSQLAPLHNPVALEWIRAARDVLGTPQVAVFDTAYFASMPQRARQYALPPELAARHGIRRYGFHGIAHRGMWQRWCELRPDLAAGGRLLTVQLGGGCSVAAHTAGRPVDNSMGFSPAEGLVMTSRCGDIDPSAVAHLCGDSGLAPDQLMALIHSGSGLAGMSGTRGDLRELLSSADRAAQCAVDLYCYRLRKYLGAYMAVLSGADGIVFGGGVGEHQPEVRRRALEDMAWAGIVLDRKANGSATGGEALLSSRDSEVELRVLPADEAELLARDAYSLMNRPEE